MVQVLEGDSLKVEAGTELKCGAPGVDWVFLEDSKER